MKVEFEQDEVRALMAFFCDRLIEDAGLAEKDRGLLRRWRIDSAKARPLSALTDAANADIARIMAKKAKAVVRKPDWR